MQEFSDEIDEYTFNVWVSGGYLRLAEVLCSDDPEKSAEYFAEAKKLWMQIQRRLFEESKLKILKRRAKQDSR